MQAVAARIDALVAQLARVGDPEIRAQAQELVQLLMEMYGAGLARMLHAVQRGGEGAVATEALLRDELVASLLVLHDLHPDDKAARIARGLERVRELAGADVALVDVSDTLARVQVRAQRQARAPAAAELQRLIEGVVRAAAPDVMAVEIDGLAESTVPQLVQLTRTSVSGARDGIRLP